MTLCEDNYKTPGLEWFQIFRGCEEAGELLAAFEMFELNDSDTQDLPPFPDPKEETRVPPSGGPTDTRPILPVPVGIRPTLAKYRYVCYLDQKQTLLLDHV